MSTPSAMKFWSWLHSWSSLVCTVFMLLLCLSGLPLIFHHEIEHLSGEAVSAPELPAGQAASPPASLDQVLAAAQARHPERVVQVAAPDDEDERLWFVTLTPTPAPTEDYKTLIIDGRNATILDQRGSTEGLMDVMLRLHVDLFAGLPGKLFLGLMGLLLLLALVSGLVLYAPFMRRLRFGELRRERSARIRWLDLHNLLGICCLVWMLVVGATGMINTWADLLVKYWQYEHLSVLLKPYQGQPLVQPAERVPAQRALAAALAAAPGMKLSFIAFPGTAYSSPQHMTFLLRGQTPLSSRLLQPVLVDARSGELTAMPRLPWYLKALLISQPLHFGDYGGLPMKLLWALLDIVTIVVLGSGLYLWFRRRRPAAQLRGGSRPASNHSRCASS